MKKKLDMGGGLFKNAEGGSKTNYVKQPTNSKLSQSIIWAMGMNN